MCPIDNDELFGACGVSYKDAKKSMSCDNCIKKVYCTSILSAHIERQSKEEVEMEWTSGEIPTEYGEYWILTGSTPKSVAVARIDMFKRNDGMKYNLRIYPNQYYSDISESEVKLLVCSWSNKQIEHHPFY